MEENNNEGVEIFMEATVSLIIEENPAEALVFFQNAEQLETISGVLYFKKKKKKNTDL